MKIGVYNISILIISFLISIIINTWAWFFYPFIIGSPYDFLVVPAIEVSDFINEVLPGYVGIDYVLMPRPFAGLIAYVGSILFWSAVMFGVMFFCKATFIKMNKKQAQDI